MDQRSVLLNNVLVSMQNVLNEEQLKALQLQLVHELEHVTVVKHTQLVATYDNDTDERLLRLFVASKRLEGASEKTLCQYVYQTKKLVNTLRKHLPDITTLDIQYYLSEYERVRKISRRSLENMRKAINGVFIWLYDNDYIEANPLKPIKPIAYEKKPIEILTDEEIYMVREASRKNLRTRAIIELLLATGIRVSELCAINIEDLDFEKNEILIHCAKKRQKEDRVLFLSVEAKISIRNYLEYRTKLRSPDGTALFIANRNGGKRCTERIVNTSLRDIEVETGITKKLTVHTFRRTLASILYKRGMKSLDISHILGHADTRMSETYYIGVQHEDVKNNYFRYR